MSVTFEDVIREDAIFPLGDVVMTRGVSEAMDANPRFAILVRVALTCYVKGDWGNVDEEDGESNNQAVTDGDRILGAYNVEIENVPEDKIWILTEADRSVTTILFPSEY